MGWQRRGCEVDSRHEEHDRQPLLLSAPQGSGYAGVDFQRTQTARSRYRERVFFCTETNMQVITDKVEKSQGTVAYSAAEHRTWEIINGRLSALHTQFACRSYLRCREQIDLPLDRIPQLPELSRRLHARSGHIVLPIAGLIDARRFLTSLGRRVMLSTTYIRDGANPEYTPEPDIVHEVIGHVPMLLDKDLGDILELFGRAAEIATDAQMVLLERLYWFTVEFGLTAEGAAVKAWGAGLLSSFGELRHAFSGGAEKRVFDAAEAALTAYDHTVMQKTLFVVKSLKDASANVAQFLASDAYQAP
ncbi:MAG: phenylalanine 4-monooxygenase [Planctomycetes bacterium]|nr:phenylalanine 4-monooxygenase [Planctomycetota bacterium]